MVGGYDIDNVPFVEEYHYDQNVWTTKGPVLLQPRHHSKVISVPANWFNHLPGGCLGVR